MLGNGRFFVGPAASFKEKSRQLIKCGTRNIVVFFYNGEFFALDNACYHHGGPLAEGDIEDMDGHPCVVCPWHQYHITLDTGECLYWGLQLAPGKVPKQNTAQVVRSKGSKQRKHTVSVENGEVYVTLNCSGPPLESDTYAEMPLANQEPSMQAPTMVARGGQSRGIHSGMRNGHVFDGLAVLGKLSNLRREWVSSPRFVQCTRVEHICDNTKEFYFRLCVGQLPTPPVPGQFVELELPIPPPPEKPSLHRWTVCEVGKDDTLFTIIVKVPENSTGGSIWLMENALHHRLALRSVGGSFTLVHHMDEVREVGGRIVMLSAGIGVTAPYASLFHHLEGKLSGNIQDLHVIHLHVDRKLSSVPHMHRHVRWHNTRSNRFKYQFQCLLTLQKKESVPQEWHPVVECRPRPSETYIADFVKRVFSDGKAVALLCGPPEFVNAGKNALLSIGFLEKYILMDEDAF